MKIADMEGAMFSDLVFHGLVLQSKDIEKTTLAEMLEKLSEISELLNVDLEDLDFDRPK